MEDEGWSVHRPSDIGIDQAAESATSEQRRGSHLQVLCLDSTRPLDAWECDQLACSDPPRRMLVLTKCDLPRQTDCTHTAVETSSKTGFGTADFREELRRQLLSLQKHGGDAVAGTAVRCADSLRLAGQSLQNARQVALTGQDELAAADIRAALVELGKVVGEVYTDDVLDRIFSRFCVGK
jgi:tRNA modification GTPase